MKSVVDFLRNFKDVVAVEFLARTQADIVVLFGNTFCFRFRLQNDSWLAGVIRQIPAIRFIITATESQLVEGGDLPCSLLYAGFLLIETKNQLGTITNFVLCTHSLAHSILQKQNPRCRNIGGVKINYLSFRIASSSSRMPI